MKFWTRSNSEYEVDTKAKKFRRVPDPNHPDCHTRIDDGNWAEYVDMAPSFVGRPAIFQLSDNRYLRTSPITLLDESNESN